MDSTVQHSYEVYEAGDLCIDTARQRVTRHGVDLELPRLSFEFLVALVKAYPRMLTVDELLDSIWAPAVVNPETVSQRVKLLRQALGEDPAEPRYIVGVRGRGYRMGATVTRRTIEAGPAPNVGRNSNRARSATLDLIDRQSGSRWRWLLVGGIASLGIAGGYWLVHGRVARPRSELAATAASRAAPYVPSIAVLPFVNTSGDAKQEYFSDGVARELTERVGRQRGLRMVGVGSAYSLKGKNETPQHIGALLGVDHILEGTVRRAGSELRISTALLDSTNGSRLWSQTYLGKLADVFAMQEEIAAAVTSQLGVILRPESDILSLPGTHNAAAYDALLAANAEGGLTGIAHLENAVRLDPKFALAWANLADALETATQTEAVLDADYRKRAQAAMARALELAPGEPWLLAHAAYMSVYENRNWMAMERLIKAWRERSGDADYAPVVMLANHMMNVGRVGDASALLWRAQREEPLLFDPSLLLIEAHLERGNLQAAEAEYEHGKNLMGDQWMKDAGVLERAMVRRDRAQIEHYLRVYPGTWSNVIRAGLDQPQTALARIRAEVRDPHQGSLLTGYLAEWAVYFGDDQLALEGLRKAFGPGANVFVLWRPLFRNVRQLPGFKTLVRDLHLIDYWRASGTWGEFCHPLGQDDFACS